MFSIKGFIKIVSLKSYESNKGGAISTLGPMKQKVLLMCTQKTG